MDFVLVDTSFFYKALGSVCGRITAELNKTTISNTGLVIIVTIVRWPSKNCNNSND